MDLSCLSRPEKEKIEQCFEEKKVCEDFSVKTGSVTDDWIYFIGAVLFGGLAGALVEAQVHR